MPGMSSVVRNAASESVPAPRPDRSSRRTGRPAWWRDERWWLAGVCALFATVSLVLVHPTLALGWDELVYASRFGPHGPDTPFSAPRTRGVPALIAPVAALTDSVVLLRCYLTVAAALALYLGYLPWLKAVGRRGVVTLAAGLYGSLWIGLFYAGAAMPNHYVATGLAGAVGCFLARPARRGTLVALGASFALVTLMRPNDAVWPGLVLLLAAAWDGRRRRDRHPDGEAPAGPTPTGEAATGRVLAVVGGVAAGLLPWVAEAVIRFGGVLERLHAASEIQGGMSLRLSLDTLRAHAAALDGPLLCRPCDGASVEWINVGWWLLVPPLVGLGLYAARRRGRTALGLLPTAAALAVAVPYLFLMGYAAPRFLLPAYALLAPVAALGIRQAAQWARRTRCAAALLCAGAALALLHLGVQIQQVDVQYGIQKAARQDWQRIARVLHAHGVRPPCALDGNKAAIPIAHTAGCRAEPARTPDALVLRRVPLPGWAAQAGWRTYPVRHTYSGHWYVAVPVRAALAAPGQAVP